MGEKTFPRNELMSSESVINKRVGADVRYLFGSYLAKAEIAYGSNDENDVFGHLYELDYTIPDHQNWEVQLQYQSRMNNLSAKGSDDATATVGLSWIF